MSYEMTIVGEAVSCETKMISESILLCTISIRNWLS